MTANRVDKARTHLHTDCVHEQNQTEFLHKVQNVRIHAKAKMPKENANEESSGTAEAYTLDLNASDHETDGRRKGKDDHLLCDRRSCK